MHDFAGRICSWKKENLFPDRPYALCSLHNSPLPSLLYDFLYAYDAQGREGDSFSVRRMILQGELILEKKKICFRTDPMLYALCSLHNSPPALSLIWSLVRIWSTRKRGWLIFSMTHDFAGRICSWKKENLFPDRPYALCSLHNSPLPSLLYDFLYAYDAQGREGDSFSVRRMILKGELILEKKKKDLCISNITRPSL